MSTNREASKRKVMALAERFSHSSQDYRTALLQLLREFVPFDGACCTAVDPQTLLSTGAITEDGVEAIHHGIFEHEYLLEDFNRYDHLCKAAEPVATLSQATDGQLARSDRYRNVLLPAGFHDEMRAALKYDGACWGYLTLFRSQGHPFFSEQERECILALAPLIGYQLRKTSLSLPAEENTWIEEEMGILMLSDQFTLLAANPTAEKWLTLLRQWESINRDTLPRPVRAVCSRALSQLTESGHKTSMAKVCIRMPDGPYMTIQASPMNTQSSTVHLAVLFGPAKPADMLPLIAESYGLSVREKQILDQIVRGASTKELARTLHISAYTVQDHLKSIFVKTGVSSRRELIWQLFTRFGVQANQ
ncbi:helix-turn-helix transcriptional regulator [Brevibacillus sp. HB1.4B]|uniref:response regulator transcription factor n=1 Tax=Brevibacillus sp. HB1.4B TaxID=2738845 RepID=UPI00156B8BDA|nr:helix-turn-helix transcriptional regulator [Brevibacillus sp. HB1.4B]NRS20441.1 helix-turn-helix transcriptional regulator [Brevibacillus sp. HB1.4B]